MHELWNDMLGNGSGQLSQVALLRGTMADALGVIAVFILLLTNAFAEVHRVPAEFATIQAALDGASNDDTVLVGLGTYVESLYPPRDLRFVLKGEVDRDSGDYPRPVVDPAALANSNQLPCLRLDDTQEAVIEDFVFRNSPAMYPRRNIADVGGIRNESIHMTLRRCLFDSTFRGIYPNPRGVVVESCTFKNNPGIAINLNYEGSSIPHPRSVIRDSRIESHFGADLARITDSTTVLDCEFIGAEIWLRGNAVLISRCRFTSATEIYAAILANEIRGGIFSANSFTDLNVRGAALVVNGTPHTDTTRIVGNRFIRCRGVVIATAGGGLLAQGNFIHATDNLFDSCEANSAFNGFRSAMLSGPIRFNNNHLRGWNDSIPGIRMEEFSFAIGSLHGNIFNRTGLGLLRFDLTPNVVAAEQNWWGDATGPYHVTFNPNGQGDVIVGDSIDFVPWLTDTLLAVDDNRKAPIIESPIAAFPNPFNNEITIEFVTTKREKIRLDIFDLTGRLVETISDEELEIGIHRRSWNANNYSSGIYFARLVAVGSEQRPWLSKLVLLK